MKLKKLLKFIRPTQAIKIVSTTGVVTKRTPVVRLSSDFDRPLLESLESYKVHSLRHVHNDFENPENQDYIEILIIGGNDND